MGHKLKLKTKIVNNRLLIGMALAIICIVAVGTIIMRHSVNPKPLTKTERTQISKKLAESIDSGNYTGAAKTRESEYKRLSNAEEKAILARLIAADYYSAGDFNKGDIWIDKAANYYKAKNQTEAMNSLEQQKAASRRQNSLNDVNTTPPSTGKTL